MATRRSTAVFRETRYRLPSKPERGMGLWVDRIGTAANAGGMPASLRLLGQFAAVAIEDGQGVFESPRAGRLAVTTHDVILLFPDEPHRYHGLPAWSTRWVVWNGPEAARAAALAGLAPAAPLVHHADTAVARAFGALEPLMQTEDFAAVLERKQRLLGLLAELVRHQKVRGRHPRQDALDDLIRQFGDVETGRIPIPIGTMATQCHLSASQFRRLFCQRTGRSPLAFMTALRMTRAKDLLAAGVPMKDVAARTGYGDVFHFMRVFRQTTGQTAGQFVTANRERG